MNSFKFAFRFCSLLILTPLLHADPAPEAAVQLDKITVTADKLDTPTRFASPAVIKTVTARQAAETINVVDTGDAAKYFPSIFIRKRNHGDTQPVMGTRVWGVSSSARSLVYADGVLLSALIANNNTIGAPRWGLVAPGEIERIDVLYGPFSAAYPGNSMGAVMEITTRMPEKFEASLDQTIAWQSFSQYGTKNTYRTGQTAAGAGNRTGRFSFRVSGNFQDSYSQPLGYVTNATFPAGTTGGFAAVNKLGAPANVVGASGLLHTRMTNAKLKAAWDLTPSLQAAYSFGFWQNDADSSVQTYLTNAAGQPTFAGLAGFASGYYRLFQQHSSHSFTLRSDNRGDWNFEAAASVYRMDKDNQRTPSTASATAATSPSFSTAGKIAVLGGTGWSTLDFKGTWHPGGPAGANVLSFGAHEDRCRLSNTTYNTSDWLAGGPYTGVSTEGDGKTRTQALWVQEAWQATRDLKFTAGVRYEDWRARDGYNVNGATAVRQPARHATGFSPKAAVAWTVSPQWVVTASAGRARRYATAAELYQLVSTGATFTAPNPDLKPDNVVATELRIEHRFKHGRMRLSLFQDDIHDAIISQFNPLVPGSPTLYSYLSNVDHIRARGVEFELQQSDGVVRGLEWAGSFTCLDARILTTAGSAGATAPAGSANGKRLPNIPDWRASFVVTYRPDQRWAFTLGGRYSGKIYTTLDNSDVNPNVYQGFTAWFVADARLNCRLNDRWSAGLGIDNLLNRKYFFFHPFPQRTFVTDVKFAF